MPTASASRTAAIVLTITAALSAASARSADLDQPVAFDIAAQPLNSALLAFSKQAKVQVIVAPNATTGLSAPAVHATMAADAALNELLRASGLQYREVNGTVTIAPVSGTKTSDATAFRLADSGSAVASDGVVTSTSERLGSPEPGTQNTRGGSEKPYALEEVVVTGTNIAGLTNRTQPLIQITKQLIEESGYTSTQQLLSSLPQNFGGGQTGASETGFLGTGSQASNNVSNASGVNLRGLGTTSTLVLIDGHRVASSIFGTGVDISLIPLSAIDHVDVLTDGASAVYGSDAVAGVVNFVLRKNFDGAETSLTYGSVTDGSLNQKIGSQVFGHTWRSGDALVGLQFDDRGNLPTSDRGFSSAVPQPTDLLPRYRNASVVYNVDQSFTSQLDTFSEGSYTHKTSSRETTTGPDTSRGTHSSDNSNLTEQWSSVIGAKYALTPEWHVESSGSYSRESDYTNEDYAYGLLPGYENDQQLYNRSFSIWSVDVMANGSVAGLPGGPIRVAFGGDYRNESAHSSVLRAAPYGDDIKFERNVKAAFAELYIPIVSPENEIPLMRSLELSTAVRADHYSDVGSTTNPRFGLSWSPVKGIDLRASYSTSFRAPNEQEESLKAFGSQIFTYPSGLFSIPGGGREPIFLLYGSSVTPLRPETSKNISAGADFSPEFAKDLKLSVGYYRIDFRDRIITPPFDLSALLHPEIYGSLITSLADDAAAAAFLQSQIARGALYTDYAGSGSTRVRYAYNDSLVNASRVVQQGADLGATDSWKFGGGELEANGNAAIIHGILTSLTAGSTATDVSNTYGNPLHYRARVGVSWLLGGWRTSGNVNYSGNYVDTSVAPYGRIASITTFDFSSSWAPTFLRGFAVSASVINAFNRQPPATGALSSAPVPGLYYDVANGDPLGRFFSLSVKERW
jgi:outer membrane receptor protein involved in Fe transport